MAAIKKGQEIELEITDLAFGGKGLARVDGLAVFVDQTVPMDRVVARIVRKKKRHAEARVVSIIETSPDRVDPPCPYSGTCGGCKWQFLAYEKQLEYKRRQVSESVEHIALLKGTVVHPVIPSPLQFGYRNKMEFSCTDRRWLLPEELGDMNIEKGFALGLHVPGTFNKVLDIEKCLLQPDLGNAILGEVRAFIRNSGLPAYGLRSHEGFWRFLVVRHSVAHDQWLVNIVTSTENRSVVESLAHLLMDAHPEIVSVVNNVTSRRSGVAMGEYEVQVAGADHLKEAVGELEFEISANSFFQTNTRGSERLYETVRDYAELTGTENVFDLYCGTGTISLFLADSAQTITGLEIAESSVFDARKNCIKNGISNCRFISGDLKDSLKKIDTGADTMIIDPPRAGMHKDVIKHILEMKPEKIVYVSCNPATLARDLGMIKDDYHVLEVQPVDMFPHTFHIESVAKLVKKK